MQNIRVICLIAILIFSALSLSACGVTKGYTGPELPADQVSRIFFEGQSPTSIASQRVDAVQEGVFDRGIAVLPGSHTASLSVTVYDDEECRAKYCHETVEKDKDGNVTKRTCECTQPCSQDVYASSCSSSFTSHAGGDYTVEVSASSYSDPRRDRPRISVRDHKTQDWTGQGSCAPFSFSYVHTFEKTSNNAYCW